MKFYRSINVTAVHVKAIDDDDTVINTSIEVYTTNPAEIEQEARAFCAANNVDFVKVTDCASYTARAYFTLEKIISYADKIERVDNVKGVE